MNDERRALAAENLARLKKDLATLKSIWNATNKELSHIPDDEAFEDRRYELDTFLEDLDEARQTLESAITSLEVAEF